MIVKRIGVLELYEFELKGYPIKNIPVKSPRIRNSDDNECGIIEFNNNNAFDTDYKANCDIITSDTNEYIEKFTDTYHRAYSLYLAKDTHLPVDNEIKDRLNNLESLSALIERATQTWHTYLEKNVNDLEELINDMMTGRSLHKAALVYHIQLAENEKVVIFGDFHGSFHTFYRHMKRLQKLKILNGYKLSDNYRLVFLGDILDRGQYAVEIIYFMLRLMIVNNIPDKLCVILNRGNHESEEVYTQGPVSFQSELIKKDLKKLLPLFRLFFNRLPSALILECDNKKYWLAHGGFYIDRNNLNPFYKYNITKHNIVFYHNSLSTIPLQIKWNDFINSDEYVYNKRNGTDEEKILNITPKEVYNFCKFNSINFIIRGHQDFPYNSFLLSTHNNHKEVSQNYDKRYVLGNKSTDQLVQNNFIFINTNYKNDGSNRIDTHSGPIASIALDPEISSAQFYNTRGRDRFESFNIYPVITLSTNTDFDRPLTHESFGILRFDVDSVHQYKKIDTMMGGSLYYNKYVKYKNKYLTMKRCNI